MNKPDSSQYMVMATYTSLELGNKKEKENPQVW
jgi:hypothetical protein